MKSAARLRILSNFLLLSVALLGSIYWWMLAANNERLRSYTLDQAEKRASQLAELQAHHINALLLGVDLSLQQFRNAMQAQNFSGAKMIARNTHGIFPDSAIVHVSRVNARGYFTYSTFDLHNQIYIGDREYFAFHKKHAGADKIFINKPVFSRLANQWVILITRPILKRHQFDGSAFIALSPDYFSRMLSKLELGEHDVSALLHYDGTYLARSKNWQDSIAQPIDPSRPFLGSSAPSQGIVHASGTTDSIPRIYAWYRLKDLPLTVTIGLDVKAVLAPAENAIDSSMMRSAGGFALIIVLTLGVSLLLHRAARQQQALAGSENILRQQTRHLEDVIWGTDVGTIEWDVRTDDITLNNRSIQMLGYTREIFEALCGLPLKRSALSQFFHPDSLQAAQEQLTRCFSRESDIFNCEMKMRHRNGEWIWILARSRVVEWDENGNPLRMSGTHLDITARKVSEEKLQYIAHNDLLTELPNRVSLAERMQQAMARSRLHGTFVAVAYLDLDGFKEVNDKNGHDRGDKMLLELAKRMRATLRNKDTLARIGGDEFVALIVDLPTPENCEKALEDLLCATSEPVTIDDALFQVSASIGVTIFPTDEGDADQLLRHADQAMYLAKQSGKNRYQLFDIDQAAALEKRHEHLVRVRQAIDHREFLLHYQPKVNLRTGEMIGAEALIRWQHPERGLLAPAAFMPAIENHSLSVELGEWVIDSALQQITLWKADGLHIPVSVNVSVGQLQQANFATRLAWLLDGHPDVAPSCLELEILETSALAEMQHVSAIISACRELGVRFALDDFGTGYSSLTYLKSLPVDVLKIDQTFVRDMLIDPDDRAIVEGVMGLAHAFQKTVIAEGVESSAQGRLLLSMGCTLAQGFAIAHPMAAADLPHWAYTWRPDPAWQDQ